MPKPETPGGDPPSGHDGRQLLARALEQTADSVIVTRVDGTITYVNAAFERLTGYSSAEVMGRKPSIVKSGVHPPHFYAMLWRTIRSGRAFRGLFTNRRKDGELLYEEKTITPLRDDRGRVVSFLSTAKDATDRMLMEGRLRALLEPDPLVTAQNRLPRRDERAARLLAGLTQREQQVLRLVVEGLSSREIAASLGIAASSVDSYRSRLMFKLNVAGLPGLVRLAIRLGIIQA